MATYIPTIQTKYLAEGMTDERAWGELLASGVLDASLFSEVFGRVKAGDLVHIPVFDPPTDFRRTDIASSTPESPDPVSTTDDQAVVLRAHTTMKWKRSDLVRSQEAMDEKLGRALGKKLAKHLLGKVSRVLIGALDAMNTPSTAAHTKDIFNAVEGQPTAGAMTVQTVRQARALMGDGAEDLHTLLLHSKAWNDLLRDLIENYQFDAVGGIAIRDGALRGILGLDHVVVSDQIPVVFAADAGSSGSGMEQYHSFLLGDDALFAAFQDGPEIERDQNLLVPSTEHYWKVSIDHVVHLKGLKWNPSVGGTVNPDDADLMAAANWDEAYNDHRVVKAVKIVSNGAVYA